MTAAVASAFGPEMTSLTGNTGGAVQSLPNVNKVGGRVRSFATTIAMASQASGTTFGIARLPLGAVIVGWSKITDTSLGSTTISFGDYSDIALFAAAATFTSTDTATAVGKTSSRGQPIASGYDCVSGLASKSYEDITMTTGAATMPSSGNLTIIIEYVMD